jgi:hypothetical protein
MTAIINEGGSFVRYTDPNGVPIITINRDGTVSTEGIDFADGTKQTTAASGGGAVTSRTTTLTSAQLLDLANTPIQVVPAPGAGKLIVPISYTIKYNHVTTPYTIQGGSTMIVQYTNGLGLGSNVIAFVANTLNGFFDSSASQVQVMGLNLSGVQSQVDANDLQGQGLFILINGALTLGDGTLDVTVFYATI